MFHLKRFVHLIIQNRRQALAATLLVVLGYYLPVVGFACTLFAISWRLIITGRFSTVEASALSILLYWTSIIIFYSFSSLVHISSGFQLSTSIMLGIGLVLIGTHPDKSKELKSTIHFKKSDVYAILICLVTAICLFLPIYRSSGANIAQFLSYGEDNASHYALTQYITTHNQFAYSIDPDTNGLIRSLEIYPQGFHISAASFLNTLHPLRLSSAAYLKLYSFFITFQYLLFIYWFVKCCLTVTSSRSKILSLSVMPAICLLGSFGYFMLLLYRGFQPQIFAYVFLCALFFILNTCFKQGSNTNLSLFLILTLSIGLATSWWLLLPIPFVWLLIQLRDHGLLHFFYFIKKYWLLLFLCSVAVIYPIASNILLSQKVDPLNEPGGVDNIPWSIFIYIYPLIICCAPIMTKQIHRYRLILITLTSALILALLIGGYQEITVGHLEYYFYKSMYTVLIFSFVLFFACIVELCNIAARLRLVYRIGIAEVFLGLTILFANLSNLVFLKVYCHNWFPNTVLPGDLNILYENEASHYDDIIFIGSCVGSRNYLQNRWSGARLLSESPLHSAVQILILHENRLEASRQVERLVQQTGQYLVVKYMDCANDFPILQDLQNYRNVKIHTMP